MERYNLDLVMVSLTVIDGLSIGKIGRGNQGSKGQINSGKGNPRSGSNQS
jgi:hypothetical protein